MNILMFSNTYLPHVGGVARSVHLFADTFRRMGHQVLVVAPEAEDPPPHEIGVLRVPAIQHFNGSDFAVRLPVPLFLKERIHAFDPDIVHAHHPFLLGCNAATMAAMLEVPLVFTHHTMYEQYTHYVPGDSAAMQRYAIALTVGFANLCDGVIAPSESVRRIDLERGVTSEIRAISTGVDVDAMAKGRGARARRAHGIPADAWVVGHVGRLAAEKNLDFLSRAVCDFLRDHADAWFLVVGDGSYRADLRAVAAEYAVGDRVVDAGTLGGTKLADAYHAMNVFAFASQSETQGMVLAEAMAAGVPVLAVDANGVRDVLQDGMNGRMLPQQDAAAFTAALAELQELEPTAMQALRTAALATGQALSQRNCAQKVLEFYQDLIAATPEPDAEAPSVWEQALHLLEEEWSLMQNRLAAASAALETIMEDANDA